MNINRRDLLVSAPIATAAFAAGVLPAAAYTKPANKNVKWGVSTNIWDQTKAPYGEILDDMKETGFIGIRLRGFPGILERWGVTQAQLHNEFSRRGLQVLTISFSGPLYDPAQRQKALDSAQEAMKFLGDFGAHHLVVFSPGRGVVVGEPARRTRRASASLPLLSRAPATTAPVAGSITSPTALTATIAPTMRPFGNAMAAEPMPAFIGMRPPPIFPTVAPAPAPTLPSAID